MNQKGVKKIGLLILSSTLMISCSKVPNFFGGFGSKGKDTNPPMGQSNAVKTQGLGEARGFTNQMEGQSSNRQAPKNQVYLFAFDNSTLDREYMSSLEAQSQYLMTHPGARVLLAGHTDERGSREYNVALGERRAKAVAQIMRMSGVRRGQVRVLSYGKERPDAYGHDEAAYRKNRRVEFIYEAKG